ncbi:hypothetical protein K431DRAFT_284345 [Polychaeton citri CBS 116435]|uniref:FZ domain-containing protein n=1 Tax=Polychaeton citri CBS 116435 TaxID=1314669 RepID=A0A9P4UR30_9PEZI|nr:hypothetical protein K431DRAFT_284345 [Polychaeton citri CBS 116435]
MTPYDRTLLLGLLFLTLIIQQCAWATELGRDWEDVTSIDSEDHNWHRLVEDSLQETPAILEDRDGLERADLLPDGLDGAIGKVYGRQSSTTDIDGNNKPQYKTISAGETTYWVYPKTLLQQPLAEEGTGLPGPIPDNRNVSHATTNHLDLRRRDAAEYDDEGQEPFSKHEARQAVDKQIFISINTCTQPLWQGPGRQTAEAPPLTMYASPTNKRPGPGTASNQTLVEGFAAMTLSSDDAVYISVVAPEVPSGFEGSWTYELAVSLNTYYHNVGNSSQFLFLIDTDNHGALLVTNNLTDPSHQDEVSDKWMNITPLPFTILAMNPDDTSYMGLSRSLCGLKAASTIQGDPSAQASQSNPVQMGMTNRGINNLPRQQFYMPGLNASTLYIGWVAMSGNGSGSTNGAVGGGGTIWPTSTNWTTKTDGNCQLLFNLSFCDQVAYAAPSNPDLFLQNTTGLQELYDNHTKEMYKWFDYSLQQVPCDTTSDARYSLIKSCDDCADAYKEWLCAVTIPRCEDFSRNESWLQPRNMGQSFYNGTTLPDSLLDSPYVPMPDAPTLPGSPAFKQTYRSSNATFWSRNPSVIIDQIKPGPYREVKPCEDLCYGLVQACPATFGFACPLKGRGLERDYGTREGNHLGNISCSYMGALYIIGGAGQLTPNWVVLVFVGFMAIFGFLLG